MTASEAESKTMEEAAASGGQKLEPTTTIAKPDEPPKDEEGLLLKYDVIICGTGLVQSILASALTRAGKTVLHCDGNDHYGELDTVWTFDYLQELLKENNETSEKDDSKTEKGGHSLQLSEKGAYQSLKFHGSGTNTRFPIVEIGTSVQTLYGRGKVVGTKLPNKDNNQNGYGHVAVTLANWTMADGSHPTVYIGVVNPTDELDSNKSPEQILEHCLEQQRPDEIQSTRTIAAQHILRHQSRSLALDVTPKLLYASGAAVQGFLTSGVAEHLEFQTMQAVYWLQHQAKNNNNNSATLERVPCSKGDVFQSPLLPPLDKRRFMKFFQLAMDYATEREMQQQNAGVDQEEESAESPPTTGDDNAEEGVLSLNERQLNQGRSLARPQNKAVSQKDLSTLYECMNKNMEFDAYLQDHAKLSPALRELIRHALAMEITGTPSKDTQNGSSTPLSTREGMGRLCDHLTALGRYGTTAFLTPLYGAGEISQFFCRSAAVYGATYLLRRVPAKVNFAAIDEKSENGNQRVDSVTICSHEEDNNNPFGSGMEPIPKEKTIQASHMVLAKEAKLHAKASKRLFRRISVVRGNVLSSTTRSVIIIPPYGIGDHKYAIHGLVLDETANVAPHGCTLLHLTTVVDGNVANDSDSGCLEKAASVILESSASSSSAEQAADEIFRTTFSYAIYDHDDDVQEASDQELSNSSGIEGLHEIGRAPMPLAVDEAFDQAKRIFHQICGPKAEFLALSLQMQAKLKEQLQDAYRGPNQVEDDAEQHVLDSAMEMLS